LNQRLPEDIRIQLSEEVEPDFHPRYCDSEKTYEYRILNRKFPVPTERLYSYFYHYKLDVDKMKEATSYLIGRHDFASFCGSGAQVKTTIRTVTSMDVWRDGDMVTIRISGTGFLYNMVRIISGTLIEIGNGQYPPERMDKILKACDRGAAGPTAPAQGLTLMGIEFF
jgi:tRNA pseudouridine38-40 synthase